MKIKINKLTLENIGGVKGPFVLDVGGKNATVSAENGVGKTTLADGFRWCLFGENSAGDKVFGLRPLDGDNNPIRGVVVAVELDLDIDGVSHIYRREHHENVVRKQVMGFTTKYSIDGLDMPMTRYNKEIAELLPKEVFQLLTDPDYFNNDGRFKWSKRRGILLDVAGEVGTPEGFDELLASLGDREMGDYKKVLKDRVKLHTTKKDGIVPRIDENQLKLTDYAENAVDVTDLEKQRHDLKGELAALDLQRSNIIDDQAARQAKIDDLNILKDSLSARTRFLKDDPSRVQDLIDEKVKITLGVADKQAAFTKAEQAVKDNQTKFDGHKTRLAAHMVNLDAARQAYLDHKNTDIALPPAVDGVCSLCNQDLPAGMKESAADKRAEAIGKLKAAHLVTLEALATAARILHTQLCVYTAEADALIVEQVKVLEDQDKASIELEEAETYKLQRCTGIDEALALDKPVDPDKDTECKILNEQIEAAAAEIGDSTVDQLEAVEDKRVPCQCDIELVNVKLIAADTIKEVQPRIDELKSEESELAQKIADAEKELEDIKNYYKAECVLIEAAVNGKFKHVTWRLFKDLLKKNEQGEADTVPCCDALLNGVAWKDMSDGEKNLAGIDIINTLSEHYNACLPLFHDNAEGFTKEREAKSQVIELHAKKSWVEEVPQKDGSIKKIKHDYSKLVVEVEK